MKIEKKQNISLYKADIEKLQFLKEKFGLKSLNETAS
jgi:hypothetical protein